MTAPAAPAPEHEPVLTITDLANRLNVSVRTVRKWRDTGTDPIALKVGKHVRYRLSDVIAWEEAHRERR